MDNLWWSFKFCFVCDNSVVLKPTTEKMNRECQLTALLPYLTAHWSCFLKCDCIIVEFSFIRLEMTMLFTSTVFHRKMLRSFLSVMRCRRFERSSVDTHRLNQCTTQASTDIVYWHMTQVDIPLTTYTLHFKAMGEQKKQQTCQCIYRVCHTWHIDFTHLCLHTCAGSL